jgi:hypothetical protein
MTLTANPTATATGITASPTISLSPSTSAPNQTQIPIKLPSMSTSQRKTISSMQMASENNSNATSNSNNININIPVQFNPIQFNSTTSFNSVANASSQNEQTAEDSSNTNTSSAKDIKTSQNENESKIVNYSNGPSIKNNSSVDTEGIKQEETTVKATNGTTNCTSGSASGNGGGICSVLLEVIEKLRDAETLSDDSNKQTGANLNGEGMAAIQTEASSKESLKAAKKLKRKLKLDKNGNEIAKGPASQKVKKPKIAAAAENGASSEEKKLRKKRTSKKLCQLLQEKNEMNTLMQQQQTQMECSGLGQNYETCASLASSSRRSTKFNESSANECTIETSVVNSLYEDEDALLNKFDASVSLTSRNDMAAVSALPGASLMNQSLAQQSEQLLQLQQQQHLQQLQQQLQQPKIVNVNFACFRCLNLFNDLSLLAEHKTSCQKILDQDELAAKSADDSNIYLCDMCAGGGLSSHGNAGIQFKCFTKLDMLIEHCKSDHYDEFTACLDTASSSSTISSHSPAVSLS